MIVVNSYSSISSEYGAHAEQKRVVGVINADVVILLITVKDKRGVFCPSITNGQRRGGSNYAHVASNRSTTSSHSKTTRISCKSSTEVTLQLSANTTSNLESTSSFASSSSGVINIDCTSINFNTTSSHSKTTSSNSSTTSVNCKPSSDVSHFGNGDATVKDRTGGSLVRSISSIVNGQKTSS